jgi:hypothetical protein
MKTARLEDFGARGVVSPSERFRVYQEQSKGLPKMLQAKFWIGVLDRDPEVRKLLELKEKTRRRRS